MLTIHQIIKSRIKLVIESAGIDFSILSNLAYCPTKELTAADKL